MGDPLPEPGPCSVAGAPCSASRAGRPVRRGFWRAARGTGRRSQPRAGSADRTPVPGALPTAAEVWAAWGGVSGPRVCAKSSAGSPFPRLCSLLGRGLSGSRPGDGPVIEKARRGSRGRGRGRGAGVGGGRRARAGSPVWEGPAEPPPPPPVCGPVWPRRRFPGAQSPWRPSAASVGRSVADVRWGLWRPGQGLS